MKTHSSIFNAMAGVCENEMAIEKCIINSKKNKLLNESRKCEKNKWFGKNSLAFSNEL